MKYFSYDYGLTMTNGAFSDFFGGPPRKPETWMAEREFDIAASIQRVCEEIVLRMARYIHEQTRLTRLCMAGGVALNCVANGRLIRETPFKELFVQPAAGDAGGSVGVAHYVYNTLGKQPRGPAWTHAYLGPEYDDAEIRAYLEGAGATYRVLSDGDIVRETARLIADGNVIGWFQGRMEFGPRALGGRSILADPRDPEMNAKVNNAVKFREWWRPFAPSFKKEAAGEYLESATDSPFMILTAQVRAEKRGVIPSVTHVDGSARPQTVEKEINPLYWRLIDEFGKRTGVPVIMNTSFNLRGEAIVHTPTDATRTFFSSGMDALVIGSFLVKK